MTITWSHDGGLSWDALETAPSPRAMAEGGSPAPGGSGAVMFQVTVN